MRPAPIKILLRCTLVMLLVMGPVIHTLAMVSVIHHGVENYEFSNSGSSHPVPSGHEETEECTGNCICTQMPITLPLQQGMTAGVPPKVMQGNHTVFAMETRSPDPYPPELL